jgi:hypothetical protein
LYFYFSGLLLRRRTTEKYPVFFCFIKRNPVSICGTDDGSRNTNRKERYIIKKEKEEEEV